MIDRKIDVEGLEEQAKIMINDRYENGKTPELSLMRSIINKDKPDSKSEFLKDMLMNLLLTDKSIKVDEGLLVLSDTLGEPLIETYLSKINNEAANLFERYKKKEKGSVSKYDEKLGDVLLMARLVKRGMFTKRVDRPFNIRRGIEDLLENAFFSTRMYGNSLEIASLIGLIGTNYWRTEESEEKQKIKTPEISFYLVKGEVKLAIKYRECEETSAAEPLKSKKLIIDINDPFKAPLFSTEFPGKYQEFGFKNLPSLVLLMEAQENYQGGKFKEALTSLEYARWGAKDSAIIHFEKGKTYQKLNMKKKALLNYDKAVMLSSIVKGIKNGSSGFYDCFMERSKLRFELDDYEGAGEDAEKVLRYGPKEMKKEAKRVLSKANPLKHYVNKKKK